MNSNNTNINKTKNTTKINKTSSKPVKKMILWTRNTNSKSSSPHMKPEVNPEFQRNKLIKPNNSGQKLIKKSKEKNTLFPSINEKDPSNNYNNRNYLNNSKLKKNKLLNSQISSFQSNSNEENKSSSKLEDSNSKKSGQKPKYFNNIKFKKYININYSLNNNVNINSSEYHINNTYKYFQESNNINLRKKKQNKAQNKTNIITYNNIFINPSKKSINKKKNFKG